MHVRWNGCGLAREFFEFFGSRTEVDGGVGREGLDAKIIALEDSDVDAAKSRFISNDFFEDGSKGTAADRHP